MKDKQQNEQAAQSQESKFLSGLEGLKLTGPAKDFASYCEEELEQRRNIEPDLDEELYDEAVKLVLRKLGALEAEGFK